MNTIRCWLRALLRSPVLWVLAQTASSATWYVATNGIDSAEGTSWAAAKYTIQAAVDLAEAGDTVLVSNGTYATGTRVVFGSLQNRVAITNAISVQSVNGPAKTAIRGSGQVGSNAVRCVHVGSNAVLHGFTLTNGTTRSSGHADLEMSGGGVWCADSGVVSNCILVGNTASNAGGGAAHGTLVNCVLAKNVTGQSGGGAAFSTLYNCTLVANRSAVQGGGCHSSTLYNCIASTNVNGAAANNYASNCILNYTCALPLAPGPGNIAAEPRFVGIASNNFRLASTSPCIDAGSSAFAFGTYDLDGHARIVNAAVDMGAYEIDPNLVVLTVVASPPVAGMAAGSGSYTVGSNALLSAAVTNFGWLFTAWNDGDTNPIRTVVVPASNVTYTALFSWDTNLAVVSVQTNPPAAGRVTGGGVYPVGSSAVLSATVTNARWAFSMWNDGETNPVRTIVVAAFSNSFTAVYTRQTLTWYVATNGNNAFPGTNWASAKASVQAGINASATGDVVLVGAGRYALTSTVNIALGITVRSEGDPRMTILDGGQSVRCVNVTSPQAAVMGFTITRGLATSGGGVQMNGGVLEDCVVVSNEASGITHPYGGGIYATNAAIRRCQVTGNRNISTDLAGGAGGGGVYVNNCLVENCLIAGNTLEVGNWDTDGAGIGAKSSTLLNCTVVSNVILDGGFRQGAGLFAIDATAVRNCIIKGNTGAEEWYALTNCVFSRCCTTPLPPGTGHITNAPKFVDAGANDFRLGAGSPGLDAGDNAYVLGAVDLAGRPRIVYGTVDLGAYESYFNVTAVASPVDAGTAGGTGSYPAGSNVVLTAAAKFGWLFSAWDDGVTNATRSVVALETNVTYTAIFTQQFATVSVVTNPPQGGAVSGAGTYPTGSNIVLMAIPAPTWRFTTWNGGYTSATRIIMVPATNIVFTANFTQRTSIVSVQASPTSGGGASGAGTYQTGSNVVLAAVANPGWRFTKWQDNDTNVSRVIVVPVSNTSYTAFFTQQYAVVNAVAEPAAGGIVTGSGTYQTSSNVVLTASARPNWTFTGWNDGNTNTTRIITVPSTNITYTAGFFRPSPVYWYVAVNGNDSSSGIAWASSKRTIQAAVDVSYPGDVVIVSNGTYDTGWRYAPGQPVPPLPSWPTRLVISNAVTVRSLNGPEQTVITGSGSLRCVYLVAGATLSGFTLSDGLTVAGAFAADGRGGGVYGTSLSCTVSNCVLRANEASQAGGGAFGCSLSRCFLTDNVSYGKGGGASGCALANCVVAGNYSAGGSGGGAADCALSNCTLTGNAALTEGGGAARCAMVNCIAQFNSSDIASPNINHSECTNSYCCTYPLPPGAGNITNDPGFAAAGTGDYTLAPESPCIDAGNNSNAAGSRDLSGGVRIVNGTVDMGAFESPAVVTVLASPADGGSVSGGGAYPPGTQVVIGAAPAAFWSFASWNDGDTNLSRTIQVPESHVSYTAHFTQQTAVVTGLASPEFGGTVGGGGTHQVGDTILLSATPAAYWLFAGWTDGETNATRSLVVAATDATYTAQFVQPLATLAIQASPAGAGSVSGSGTYSAGSNVVITATANAGWRFWGWQDGNTQPVRLVSVPATGATFIAGFHSTAVVDFDGDGKSDIATYWPGGGSWHLIPSSGATLPKVQLGASTMVPVAADYDGDGRADWAAYHASSGSWYIRQSSTSNLLTENWGWVQAIAVPADYDGDGKADLATYVPAEGNWYILESASTNVPKKHNWGWSQAIPVAADYDGDGRADLATYVPSTGQWAIWQSGSGQGRFAKWGWSRAMAVPADYDGDRKADLATYVPADGTWYVSQSSLGGALKKTQWGWSQAAPVPADYDGDGKTDLATYHPPTGMWYILESTGGMKQQQWGWVEASPVMPQFQINRRYFPTP